MAFKNAYALTGGIATGKSTVCSLLRMHGFSIIDADVIAKEKLEESKKELKELFGEEVFCGSDVDRKRLAEIIFNSPEQRAKLNALLHPQIREEIKKRSEELDKFDVPYIMDIPLFFESGGYDCKMSVVVYTPRDVQIDRLINREGLDEAEAIKRVDAQIDIEKKRVMADWVIDNSNNLKHVQLEVEQFVDYVRGQNDSSKV